MMDTQEMEDDDLNPNEMPYFQVRGLPLSPSLV